MNKKLLISVGVLVTLAVVGIYFFTRKSEEKFTYAEVPVIRGNIQITINATGLVSPQNRLEIKSSVAGRVEEVLVSEGDKLKKGDVMAWISSTERAAILDSVRSSGKQELKRWEDLYRPTPVIAPIDGTLILRSVETGQSFTTTDAIFVMADRLTVKAQIDETDIAQVKNGQAAVITLDAYPRDSIQGKVVHVAYDATVTNNVTTYAVDVLPDLVPDFMRSGMTANVNVEVENKKDILLVPISAVTTTDDGQFVEVKQGDKRTSVSVELGLDNGKVAELLEGPLENEIVLVKGPAPTKGKKAGSNPFMPTGPRGKKR